MRQDRPPSVDALARSLTERVDLPHPVLVEVARAAIAAGTPESAETMARLRARRLLGPVINATGTLLHTNLGRAPVEIEQRAGYSNVELDLASGSRGSRQSTIGDTIALACGAESAMVVNNCAAGLLLVLSALADGRGVAVSRGEMVEIGGAFRVPDVMRQSGARLIEVGTTNRTRRSDYQRAMSVSDIALLLHVHRSNYSIEGFSETTAISALASLGPPVVADLGSGLLDASCPWLDGPPPAWLRDEPAVRQTLRDGADLVIFSGDKLLGGPQAGLIAGDRDLVRRCSSHPLARALRPGSLVIGALQSTLLAYLRGQAADRIPFWRLATRPLADIRTRAESLAESLADPRVRAEPTTAVPGGGTLPSASIPSWGVTIEGDVSEQLRARDLPVISRVHGGRTVCDLRTVEPDDDPELLAAVGRSVEP